MSAVCGENLAGFYTAHGDIVGYRVRTGREYFHTSKIMASSQRGKKAASSKYYTKYLESFHGEWNCIKKSSMSEYHAYCGICKLIY